MVIKVLSIANVLYLGYSLVFLFENTNSYLVYTKDILCTENKKKFEE